MFKHTFCGGKHSTVAEAKACQSGAAPLVAVAAQGQPIDGDAATKAKAYTAPAWKTSRATERQVSYLKDLIAKRCAERAPIDVVETAMNAMDGKPISFEEARRAIEAIKAQPYREATPAAEPAKADKPNVKKLKAQVPDGRYAVNVPGFGQDKLQFFFVRMNRKGYVRIDQVVSDSRMPVAFGKYAAVLQAIIDVTVAAAAKAYGDGMSECSKCGRALSDPDNPYKPYGYGPDCGPKVMGALAVA